MLYGGTVLIEASMHSRQIDQMVRDSAGLNVPANIGEVILRADHLHINDCDRFLDLVQYLDLQFVEFEQREPLVLYFSKLQSPERSNVIMLLRGSDLDPAWVSSRGHSTVYPPNFYMFAYSEPLQKWFDAALVIGKGHVPSVTLKSNSWIKYCWLTDESQPSPDSDQLQIDVGLGHLFCVKALEQMGMASLNRTKLHIDFVLTAHATHTVLQ